VLPCNPEAQFSDSSTRCLIKIKPKQLFVFAHQVTFSSEAPNFYVLVASIAKLLAFSQLKAVIDSLSPDVVALTETF